ncbi:MAG: sigma-70 family RNA polymerase sigma factor [Acidimicrobiales bacterium]
MTALTARRVTAGTTSQLPPLLQASRTVSHAGEDALWQRYWHCREPVARNELILYYQPLVKLVASRLPSSVRTYWEIDDLRSFGLLGLIEAIGRWAPTSPGARFEAYATKRVRGSIFDEMRRLDWLPRGERRRVVDYQAAGDDLSGRLRRTPERREILAEMRADDAEREKIVAAVQSSQILHLDRHVDAAPSGEETSLIDLLVSDRSLEPESRVISEERLEEVRAAMTKLPDRQRTVVTCHFLGGLTQEQIGSMLGVSNSRVCQIEASAMQALRRLLVATGTDSTARAS